MNDPFVIKHLETCQDIYDSAIIANLQMRMMYAENLAHTPTHQHTNICITLPLYLLT